MPNFARTMMRPLGLALSLSASACAPGMMSSGTPITSWQVPGRTAQLVRDNRSGYLAVEVPGTDTHIPLQGYTGAVLEDVLSSSGDSVAVIRGGSQQCPVGYTLVAINETAFKAARIGDCRSEYRFVSDGRSVLATQQGVQDPLLWTLEGSRLDGPVRQSAIQGPHTQQAQGRRRIGAQPPGYTQEMRPYQGPGATESFRTPSRAGDDVIPGAVMRHNAGSTTLPTIRLTD